MSGAKAKVMVRLDKPCSGDAVMAAVEAVVTASGGKYVQQVRHRLYGEEFKIGLSSGRLCDQVVVKGLLPVPGNIVPAIKYTELVVKSFEKPWNEGEEFSPVAYPDRTVIVATREFAQQLAELLNA